MKTKSRCDLAKQIERIKKLFYSLPNWWDEVNYPYMGQMNLALSIAEDYNTNIHWYLGGDYFNDDKEEFMRRYNIQVPKRIYSEWHSSYTKYLINKNKNR